MFDGRLFVLINFSEISSSSSCSDTVKFSQWIIIITQSAGTMSFFVVTTTNRFYENVVFFILLVYI